ncbi:MAG: cupin domain-containing protein [Candidatus Pacebacteria bacterium]|nr:cupin domain-containing protein [Candidatus Paceibacterota bacterium]
MSNKSYVGKRKKGGFSVAKDGAFISEFEWPGNSKIRKTSTTCGRLNPGQKAKLHRHEVSEEMCYVLSGHGEIKVGEIVEKIGKGDVVCIPARAAHSLKNISQKKLLKVLAFYSPMCTDGSTTFLE